MDWSGKAALRIFFFLLLTNCSYVIVYGQRHFAFSKGFDPLECDEMLRLNNAFLDTAKTNNFRDFLSGYRFAYRSGSVGLDNAWDLWIRDDSTIVMTIRGTTSNPKSIMADFYCAMLPAKGSIVLRKADTLNYTLAKHPRAAVHGGFLIGFAFLAKDMLPKIDSLFEAGYRNYIVTGHSQGGALCYLVSSWLLNMPGRYQSLNVKTYASAAVKPGNTYFAYDYDNVTRSEWSYSIVNSSDPVPEFPYTTQQVIEDMNEPNPYLDLYSRLNKLPFIKRIFIKRAFKKMRKSATTSSKSYQKYLGNFLLGPIKNALPEIELPLAVNTTNFIRPGVPITLIPDQGYFDHFEPIKDGPYYHHGIEVYRFLLRQEYNIYTFNLNP